MATKTNPITVEQYENSFEGCPGWRDELITEGSSRPRTRNPCTNKYKRNIQRALEAACEGTEYIVNGNSTIKFPDLHSMPSPDVFVVPTSKWEEAMRAGVYLDTTPLLTVEILSPDQDISEKVEIYLKAGVGALWIVDPKNKIVLYYVGNRKHTYQLPEEIYLPMPLKDSIKVAVIFAGTLFGGSSPE